MALKLFMYFLCKGLGQACQWESPNNTNIFENRLYTINEEAIPVMYNQNNNNKAVEPVSFPLFLRKTNKYNQSLGGRPPGSSTSRSITSFHKFLYPQLKFISFLENNPCDSMWW